MTVTDAPTDVVTGAFGFTGRHIARRLLDGGRRVRTLTNHPDRDVDFADRIPAHPYTFDDRNAIAEHLAGAETLYNTYWERLPGDDGTFDHAVENTRILVRAAESAGLDRFVHFSVSNADDSSLPYYEGKAAAEAVVRESSLSHAVLRPTLAFGIGDVLLNNIAWFLRRSPVFVVHGDGSYPVRPVSVGDVAAVAVEHGSAGDDRTVDVAGPETFAFDEFVRLVADALGVRARLVHAPPRLTHVGVKLLERIVGDVVLTWNEARGLMNGLLATDGPPAGETRLADWLAENAGALGTSYTSFADRYR